MTRKNIEAAREVRLWIGSIIAPAFIIGATIATNPYVRMAVKNKVDDVKDWFNDKKEKHEQKKKEKQEPHIEVVSSKIIHQEPL